MDFAVILHEIDSELDRLQRARKIVAALAVPHRRRRRRPKPAVIPAEGQPIAIVTPVLTLLPPKLKRDYLPRVKAIRAEPRALSAPISEKPIFVPRPPVAAQHVEDKNETGFDPMLLEAAIRKNFKIRHAAHDAG